MRDSEQAYKDFSLEREKHLNQLQNLMADVEKIRNQLQNLVKERSVSTSDRVSYLTIVNYLFYPKKFKRK